jgi:hypothetical protein
MNAHQGFLGRSGIPEEKKSRDRLWTAAASIDD